MAVLPFVVVVEYPGNLPYLIHLASDSSSSGGAWWDTLENLNLIYLFFFRISHMYIMYFVYIHLTPSSNFSQIPFTIPYSIS